MLRARVVGICVLLSVWLGPAGAHATIGTADNVPGATLLFPFFEVDLGNASGVTTLIAIQNSGPDPALTTVTLWTDWGIATLNFNLYLTGLDVQTLNLRDVFNGIIPITADDQSDPSDGISPKGSYSFDVSFPNCDAIFPNYVNPVLSPERIADLQAVHQGQASTGLVTPGLCAANDYGDGVARGYVTVDSVDQCSASRPGDSGYFAGIANDRNLLLGDYYVIDLSNNSMQADVAVSIEASSTDPRVTTAGNYTFYGRFVSGTAADHREALPTTWGATYMSGRSSLRVWRDPGAPTSPVACGGPPPDPFPLGQNSINAIVVFDTEENPHLPPAPPTPDPYAIGMPFPYATGEVPVGSPPGLPAASKQGWVFLNLNQTPAGGVVPAGVSQSWVETVLTLEDADRFSTGWSAVQLDNATADSAGGM